MFILDTNVLSELLRAAPDPAVSRWVSAQPAGVLHTTTVTQAEMLYGVRLLEPGRRQQHLEAGVKALFEQDFAGRVLAFDTRAAFWYARLAADRRRIGQPISQFDAQIAAIARAAGAGLATRNINDFVHCGLVVINPWEA